MITINKTRKYEDKTEMNEEIKNMYAALGMPTGMCWRSARTF